MIRFRDVWFIPVCVGIGSYLASRYLLGHDVYESMRSSIEWTASGLVTALIICREQQRKAGDS
jgi:hypothetical protein